MTTGATVTAPHCMTSDEVVAWWRANLALNHPAKSPCVDCKAAWRRQAAAAGRCDRAPLPLPSPTITEKRCGGCGETKALDAFSRDRSRSDGRQRLCRACASERWAARKARAA